MKLICLTRNATVFRPSAILIVESGVHFTNGFSIVSWIFAQHTTTALSRYVQKMLLSGYKQLNNNITIFSPILNQEQLILVKRAQSVKTY